MSEREQQQHHCAVQLGALIIKAVQEKPHVVHTNDAVCVLENIVNYAIAVAHDRAAQAMANVAAEKLTEAILEKHAQTAPAPEQT